MDLLAQLDSTLQGLTYLRVGVRAGGKVPVRVALLGNHMHVGDADARENAGHAFQTGAVERRVDQLEVSVGAAQQLSLGSGHKAVEGVLANRGDKPLIHRLVVVHPRHREVIDLVDGLGDGSRSLACNLATVRPVRLVAVVLGGVVAGSDVDASRAPQVAHRKRERRGGLDARIHVSLHSVGRQHARRVVGKEVAAVPRIAADGDGGVLVGLLEIGGEPLGGPSHRVDVHAVGAHAKHSAQSRGSKAQLLVKGVFELLRVILEGLELYQVVTRERFDPMVDHPILVIGHAIAPFLLPNLWLCATRDRH